MAHDGNDDITREQARSRRKREVRKCSLSVKYITQRDLAEGRALESYDREAGVVLPRRPATRGECQGAERPCPFVSCKHHLYLDVQPSTGSIVFNFPDLDPDELAETCSLDIADKGGANLEEVGAMMNVTRERIRQLEAKALAKMARAGKKLREYSDEGPVGKRHLPVLEVVR